MNVAELALKSIEIGEHVSIVYDNQEFTNVQMFEASNRIVNALKRLGVKR